MKITIHQPEYLPWIGFFDRILQSDIFVILDDVGYQKNGFINRNKIKFNDEWQWLTVPVLGRSPNKIINEVLIDNEKKWQESQLSAIKNNYHLCPDFQKYYSSLEKAFCKKWEKISDLNIYLIQGIMDLLGCQVKVIKTSDLKLAGKRTERLIHICKLLDADTYLSGPGGKEYMDTAMFEREKIDVIFQEFRHPVYPQIGGKFLPGLSIIDLLFNCGEESKNIILNSKK